MTSSNTNIIKKNVFNKPFLLTTDELLDIGQNINLVGFDNQLNLTSDDTNVVLKYGNSSSPKLLNWVEPYSIAGVNYTLFYTEVNSGFKIGDKVFIINGTYDSNELIKVNKYKKGHDGYKVIYIDKCKVVLDIEFDTNGNLPNDESVDYNDDFDDFIKIYTIKDSNEFLHVNRQITTQGGLSVDFKFESGYNNIIYTEIDFPTNMGIDWGANMGIVGSPGFFIKDNQDWINVTTELMTGTYSGFVSNSNDKLIIINDGFTYNSNEFKEDQVYKWNGDKWEINIKHENNNVAIITKSNFRKGTFNGIWNGGLYGSNIERIYWKSTTAIWNSGTLLNTIWEKGILNSLWSQPESYVAEFDKYGNPYQKSTNPDNDGYGYNFIINSELRNAIINNGNVSNSILGGTNSISVIEEHVKGNLNSQMIRDSFNDTLVNKAFFDNCGFNNANIENSIIKNSRVKNSRLFNVKSINTHYKHSLFKNSNYISDNIIKILNYDVMRYNDGSSSTFSHYVYKLYINKKSYQKFKFKDVFYLKNVRVDNTDMLNFFDKKFKIGPWIEFTDVDYSNDKEFNEYNAFISTKKENEYYFNASPNNTIADENLNGYSIDIFIKSTDYIEADFSNAHILNSDFESGIFENSNWNSGNHINNNYDNNITYPTMDLRSNNGEYNLTLSNNQIFVNNIVNSDSFKESEKDYLLDGSIVFLNMDYDTRGRVTILGITQSGTGYTSQTGLSVTGNGNDLLIDIIADTIGAVLSYTFEIEGLFNTGTDIYTTTATSGSGLVLEIEADMLGTMISHTIISSGSNYFEGDIISINSVIAVIKVSTTSKGSITNVVINSPGIGYNNSEEVIVIGGDNNAKLIIIDTIGTLTKLPDTYKVSYGTSLMLTEIGLSSSTPILPTLLPNGIFSSYGAKNRYGYIYTTKFDKSKIVSGLFKRAYFKGSLIKNELYDVNDKDFINNDKLRSLVISESIFSGNSNILSKASYINSYFVGRTSNNDLWETGIIYNSIWNGLTFNNGLIKESTWIDGIFKNGIFFNSKSFNYNTQFNYNENNLKSFYKCGDINNSNNNRYSWQNGIFENGEFLKSDWEKGVFNNGKFYYSNFYTGEINGGIIGDISINTTDTKIYSGVINYTTVDNAEITSTERIPNVKTDWYNGIFNSGIFSTHIPSGSTSSTWYNGIFNGGEFIGKAKWKDGIFNAGRFYSTYGYDRLIINGDDTKANYTWENGIFNGGEFGNKSILENSTWYDGEFRNGYFRGKVWNNGIFSFGEFLGSGVSAIGGTSSPNIKGGLYSKPANDFVYSFIDPNNYYGLWKNGFVTNINKYLDKEIYTDIKRVTDINKNKSNTIFKNVLWMSGTFSHTNATINNSVWMGGTFENGTFDSSSFNPYVKRLNSDNTYSEKFNISDNIIWKNGTLKNSDFYISEWEKGNFISGTAIGMVWKNGVANYMNAYNVFWEDGLWRNGNWEGSYFDLEPDGTVTDDYTRQILFRGMSVTGTASCHIWNVFYKDSLSKSKQETSIGNEVSWNFDNTINQPPTAPLIFEVGILNNEIEIESIVNVGANFTIYFNSNFNINNMYYETSLDNITWSTPILLSYTPNSVDIVIGLDIFYLRLSSNSIISNSLYYNNTMIVGMPPNINFNIVKSETESSDISTAFDILTSILIFDQYTNKNSKVRASIRITTLPLVGDLTLNDVKITTLPFNINSSDIDNNKLAFWPLGIYADGTYIDYTTSFTYVVIDSNGDESDNVQMQINFITN